MILRNDAFPICRATKTNGRRCQSPAQGSSAFCHHHRNLRRTPRRLPQPSPSLPILRTISVVQQQLSVGNLLPHEAGLMLQGLQYALSLSAKLAESGS